MLTTQSVKTPPNRSMLMGDQRRGVFQTCVMPNRRRQLRTDSCSAKAQNKTQKASWCTTGHAGCRETNNIRQHLRCVSATQQQWDPTATRSTDKAKQGRNKPRGRRKRQHAGLKQQTDPPRARLGPSARRARRRWPAPSPGHPTRGTPPGRAEKYANVARGATLNAAKRWLDCITILRSRHQTRCGMHGVRATPRHEWASPHNTQRK